jgi:hypothetical protein
MQSFEAKRVRVESMRSLEEVLLNLRNVVGTTIIQQGNIQEAASAPFRPGYLRHEWNATTAYTAHSGFTEAQTLWL